MDRVYDVIVVGAGHAGIEAACAAATMGCSVLMVTLRKENIGLMSCNPAIGGVGKGQLVKEIDALGGQMARAADACGVQFRILNASKGPAVHSSRAQIDMYRYNRWMRDTVASFDAISVCEAEVTDLLIGDGAAHGVMLSTGQQEHGCCVVLCPGTFLDGLIHLGLRHYKGGRISESSSEGLSPALRKAGFGLMRFKTGTCPRLDKKTIDFSRLSVQDGDDPPQPFSFFGTDHARRFPELPQLACHITHTNEKTHQVIRANLDRSPLYTGIIQATGVRYCPSIEDKLVRFPDKIRHQIFLEPQGSESEEIYPNGLSTSLPEDVQEKMIRSITGLEEAQIVRFGYGIEHTVIDARNLCPSLESKPVRNLFLAGQINGTTGYEEAAAQGLMAGINAAVRCRKREPFVLDRSSSYIGVLIDDLITKGTEEPYRMFTSRVEYRLVIREDNAPERLSEHGFDLGLLSADAYRLVSRKRDALKEGLVALKQTRIGPSERLSGLFQSVGSNPPRAARTLHDLLKRPQVTLAMLKDFAGGALPDDENVLKQLEIEVKYAGFMQRQHREVERFKYLENIRLGPDMDYTLIPGLSREIREKLNAHRPVCLGAASRISGVTPAALSILMVYVHKRNVQQETP